MSMLQEQEVVDSRGEKTAVVLSRYEQFAEWARWGRIK